MERTDKKKIITKFAVHPKDTGSAQVQVAILTERINKLQEHLMAHKKDNHSRRGLLELVGKRRRHLNYLKLHTKDAYEDLLTKLKLKKVTDKTERKSVKRILKGQAIETKVASKKEVKKAAKIASKAKVKANKVTKKPKEAAKAKAKKAKK